MSEALKDTKFLINKYRIKANKNLGQNYLIDDYKLKNILSFSNLKSDDTVLEIGSGIGTLTVELAKKVKNVISIEKDSKIYNILNERLERSLSICLYRGTIFILRFSFANSGFCCQ